jgi:hypothetical protein
MKGVFTEMLSVDKINDNTVALGTNDENTHGVNTVVCVSKKEFTDLCIMWLLIESPEIIKEDS